MSITWPYRRLKCPPIEVKYFLKLSADKLPLSNDRRLKFIVSSDSYEICCVFVTMAPYCKDFDFKLTLDARIQPVFLKFRRGRRTLCSIFQVVSFDSWSWQSSVLNCDVFCVFFHWMCKMKDSCYQESSVIHRLFVYWVFGWEMHRLSSVIRFWMASFSFFTLLNT